MNHDLKARALAAMPGGVNSPVRAYKSVGGTPPHIVRGAGALVWDEDGNEYVDLVGSYGPLILGHLFSHSFPPLSLFLLSIIFSSHILSFFPGVFLLRFLRNFIFPIKSNESPTFSNISLSPYSLSLLLFIL